MTTFTKKAKEVCTKLGKPSEANAKVLSGLFPSCQSVKKMKFDPLDQCVVAEQQRRKKSASKGKGRSKLVTVVVLNEIPSCIPKGATREHLRKIGRIKEIAFQRYFDEEEVEKILTENFSSLGEIDLQYLQPHKKNYLTIASNQKLNGIGIIELAKSGSLYMKSSLKVSRDDNTSANSRTTALIAKADEILQKLNVSIHVHNYVYS